MNDDARWKRSADGERRADVGIREFAHLKPRLRDDLEFQVQVFGGTTSYVVEDRVRSKFFRIGLPEYRFLSLLDGTVTIENALASNAAAMGRDALTLHEAAMIVRWLIDNELAFTSASRDPQFLGEIRNRRRRAKNLSRMNLIFLKVPLVNPDRALDSLMPWLRWMLGGGFALAWFAVISSGLYQITANWDRFSASAGSFLSMDNWLWIALIWTALKVVHELFHGLVCKKYDGEIYEAGVILILFAPIGYVDATSSWRFPSRWQRMHTAVAGMYIEFLIAGVAAWIWAGTEPGLLNHAAWNTVVVASITTLLFNANPLMKFDGYYVFADLVDIPNLYGEGQRFVKYIFRRFMLGVDARLPTRRMRERWIIAVYGVAALAWRILVIATLLFVASTLFHGAGLAIAVLSGVVLLAVPAGRFLRYLFMGAGAEKPSLLRFALTGSLLAAGVYALLVEVRWAANVEAPAVVAYSEHHSVRAGAAGFVESINVRAGEEVEAGTLLVRLSNPELAAAIEDHRLQLEQNEVRRRIGLLDGRQDAVESLQDQARDLQARLADLEAQYAAMSIVAPESGTVLARRLDRLSGLYVSRGDLLLEIGRVERKDLVALVEQADVEAFRRREGAQVWFTIPGRGPVRYRGTLEGVDPRADRAFRHEALTALAGGPIGVTPRDDGGGYRFTRPRFEARVRLPPTLVDRVNDGEMARVMVLAAPRSLGWHWYRLVSEWVDGVLSQARGEPA